MTSTSDDQEVERYLGFRCEGGTSNKNYSSCYTPGRFKSTTTSIRRPSSACAILSPARTKTPKYDFYRSADRRKTPKSKEHSRRVRNTTSSISKNGTPKTPKESDRFIPPRGSMNFASSHHKIMQSVVNNENETVTAKNNSQNKYFEQTMSHNFSKILGDKNNGSILQYQSKFGTPTKGTRNSSTLTPAKSNATSTKKERKIPTVSERVLDAPNYVDDYYLNLLDWSKSADLLAVALDQSVYVWTPATGDINHLCEFETASNYVSSVRWIEDGNQIAIGTVDGNIQLWDAVAKKRLRQMGGHSSRVGSLAWNSHILSSGSRSGSIHNHDVRIPEHHISSFTSHTQEVCGLEWSPSQRYLASGSNNNKLIIWDWNNVQSQRNEARADNNYVHMFDQHRAAVKAIAWCPWQHHVLASGGGAADKTIRFWNVNTGNCLNTISTDSQVSSLLWNESYKEIISGHGYPNNQLTIWQYPSMHKKIDLLGHTSRILQMTLSPDQSRVMSAAGDETLRLWHCFEQTEKEKLKKRKQKHTAASGGIMSLTNIR